MSPFNYIDQELYAEEVPISKIVQQYGTPCYIYSKRKLTENWQAFSNGIKNLNGTICYAVKANSNLAVLNLLAKLGSGFDIVSIGELERVLRAGGNPKKIIFSGVGKQRHEIEAALDAGIASFNVESFEELYRLNAIAEQLQKIAPIAIRVNPNIDAGTHPYITTGLKDNKFGIDYEDVLSIYQEAKNLKNIQIVGAAFHLGSQLIDLKPYADAIQLMLVLYQQLKELGIQLEFINLGGGLGIQYQQEQAPAIADYTHLISQAFMNHPEIKIIIEPGRAIAAPAGILVTRVDHIKITKTKNFAIVDAGMNDLIRPALYNAYHEIKTINQNPTQDEQLYDVVGPICETGDFFAKERKLKIGNEDLIAILNAGAYGFVMSSNYNTRPRACEIMVDGSKFYEIRARESWENLFQLEKLLPE
jgi:diaminopimelate decarboxylase